MISPLWSSESRGGEGPQSKNQTKGYNIETVIGVMKERYTVTRELISRGTEDASPRS